MCSLEHAVSDVVKKYQFKHVSDLTADEFTRLMIDILKEASETKEFDDVISKTAFKISHR